MTHYAHIENEVAYEAAIDRRIKANRQKGAFKRWIAQHDDAERLYNWLEGQCEFGYRTEVDPRCFKDEETGYIDHIESSSDRYYGQSCNCRTVSHPATKFNNSPFLIKLREQLREWGNLSEKQTQAVRDSLARAEGLIVERDAERKARTEADRAQSKHVGEVGQRLQLTITCERNFSFESQFGTTFINICRDEEGNVLVYKGGKEFERGQTYTGKATVKAHDERDGVAQTLIARPAFA